MCESRLASSARERRSARSRQQRRRTGVDFVALRRRTGKGQIASVRRLKVLALRQTASQRARAPPPRARSLTSAASSPYAAPHDGHSCAPPVVVAPTAGTATRDAADVGKLGKRSTEMVGVDKAAADDDDDDAAVRDGTLGKRSNAIVAAGAGVAAAIRVLGALGNSASTSSPSSPAVSFVWSASTSARSTDIDGTSGNNSSSLALCGTFGRAARCCCGRGVAVPPLALGVGVGLDGNVFAAAPVAGAGVGDVLAVGRLRSSDAATM